MNLTSVILGPVVTEKAMALAEKNQHVLFITKGATKDDVKSAVKKFFGVSATSVNIIKMPEKIRVRGARGATPKRKPRVKAIITLSVGQSFDPLKTKIFAEKSKKSAPKPSSSDVK